MEAGIERKENRRQRHTVKDTVDKISLFAQPNRNARLSPKELDFSQRIAA
jgi:hypothetical protein